MNRRWSDSGFQPQDDSVKLEIKSSYKGSKNLGTKIPRVYLISNHKGSQRIFAINQEMNYLNFEFSEPSTVPGSKNSG